MKLATGEKAPDFVGSDQDGNQISSMDFENKYWLLYFYPKDNTSGCTKEACEFRDHFKELKQYIDIVGVSADSKESHKKFIEKNKLPFPLLSDKDQIVIKSFGADGLIFPKRVSFLIGPDGHIMKIYEKVNADTHAREVLSDVKEFLDGK
jgi:thioredoxin-dependent peroxiredoxin